MTSSSAPMTKPSRRVLGCVVLIREAQPSKRSARSASDSGLADGWRAGFAEGQVADFVPREGVLWAARGDGEADDGADCGGGGADCESDRVAVRRGVAVGPGGGREDRGGDGPAERAADGAGDGVHAGGDACFGGTDVLDDEVDHRREGEPYAGAEEQRGDVDLPALVAREREDGVRGGGQERAGKERRL